MEEGAEKFERIRRAHVRLHGAEVVETSVVVVPLDKDAAGRLLAAVGENRQEKLWSVAALRLRRGASSSKLSAGASTKKRSRIVTMADVGEPVSQHATLSARFGHICAVEAVEQAEPSGRDVGHFGSSPKSKPDVKASPAVLKRRVDLFPSCSFTLASPAAEVVRLVWEFAGDSSPAQGVLMEGEGAGCHQTSILLDEGHYWFAYEVDGALLPPCTHAQRLRLQGDGIFASLEQRRPTLILSLVNRGRVEEFVRITTEDSWLAGCCLVLPPGRSVHVAIKIIPQYLNVGLNDGALRLRVRRGAEFKEVATVKVKVEAVSGGVVPVLECDPPEAKDVWRGVDDLRFAVNVRMRGQGALSGELLLLQTGDHVDFRIEDVVGEATFQHLFNIQGECLPPQVNGTLKVMLITDSYLANQRVLQAEIPYRAVYLKKSVSALLFGSLQRGEARALRLTVRRSDGGGVELQTAIPAHAASYLTATHVAAHTLSFRLDASRLQPDTHINEVVTLTDKSSGLQDKIKVIAEVAGA